MTTTQGVCDRCKRRGLVEVKAGSWLYMEGERICVGGCPVPREPEATEDDLESELLEVFR